MNAKLFILIMFVLSFVLTGSVQSQNKYLIKTKKEGDNTIYYTKEGLFDKVYSHKSPDVLVGVGVNLKTIDLTKAGIDTTGLSETVLAKNGMPVCAMDYYGSVQTKAVYSIAQNAGQYGALLGKKLKNGLWQITLCETKKNGDYYFQMVHGTNKNYMQIWDVFIFQSPEGLYGLVYKTGYVLVEAKYTDVKLISHKRTHYDLSYLPLKSVEETYHTGIEKNEKQMDDYPEFIEFSNENSNLLYCSNGKIYENYCKISNHTLKQDGSFNIDFTYIEYQNGKFDFKSNYYDDFMRSYKYALMEQVRRDTTAGADKNWSVVKGVDYSRPFDLQKVDSIKGAITAYTYVNTVKGLYNIDYWEEPNGEKYYDMGIGKNYFLFKVLDADHVSLDIEFAGAKSIFSMRENVGYKVHINSLKVAPGYIGSFKKDVGLLITSPDNILATENKGDIKEIWAEYNWNIAELQLRFNVVGYPGTFTVKAKHINSK